MTAKVQPPTGSALARVLREIARDAAALAAHCDGRAVPDEPAWRAEQACVDAKESLRRVHLNTREVTP